jgi:MoaA/NifB/PqqE/SkfB family radical SAM enzyme
MAKRMSNEAASIQTPSAPAHRNTTNSSVAPEPSRTSFLKKIWQKLFGPQEEAEVPSISRQNRRWRLIQVESALACNLKCVMCPWKDFREEEHHGGIMQPEIWEAIKPHLPDAKSVDFTGGGEPLLQPRLLEWISDAHHAGCETGILTNALLLTKEKSRELIAAGLDWICISMDGASKEQYEAIRIGSNFEKVCENVANFSALRTGKVPLMMINFVMMSHNFHQVEDIVRLAAELGVDQVNFKQCEVIRGEHGKGHGLFGKEETKEIGQWKKELDKALRLAKKLNIRTTASPFTPIERPVCDQDPRDSVFISYEGDVAPCINLIKAGRTTYLGEETVIPSVCYGRLPDVDLRDLMENETCKLYRERFQQRSRAYEQVYMRALMTDSGSNAARLMQTALKEMPEAPEGCKACHFLCGI